jgi:hypothetical protein
LKWIGFVVVEKPWDMYFSASKSGDQRQVICREWMALVQLAGQEDIEELF